MVLIGVVNILYAPLCFFLKNPAAREEKMVTHTHSHIYTLEHNTYYPFRHRLFMSIFPTGDSKPGVSHAREELQHGASVQRVPPEWREWRRPRGLTHTHRKEIKQSGGGCFCYRQRINDGLLLAIWSWVFSYNSTPSMDCFIPLTPQQYANDYYLALIH